MTTKQPKITLRGRRAIASGRPLFVQGLDGTWALADLLARERAARMLDHAVWIYGVESARTHVVTRWQIGYERDGGRVISTRVYDRRTADTLVRRLRARGNDAYLAGALRVRVVEQP